MKPYLNEDLRNSIYDGLCAHVFATLTGGVFLTGFALYLGMSELMIGFLGSIPFLVTVFQLPTSYVLGKDGRRKKVTYWSAAIARFSWVAVLIVAFISSLPSSTKGFLILGLFFFSQSCISTSYVSWLSWTSDLVPDDFLATFDTNMDRAGVSESCRKAILGHSLEGMDRHYLRLNDEDLRATMDEYKAWIDDQISNVDQTVDQATKKASP